MQILRWQTVNNVPTPWRNLIRTREEDNRIMFLKSLCRGEFLERGD
jgi:hypothetical protein